MRRGGSNVNIYGVMFTCLSIREVHLELASALNTDSCINAIRKFMNRRLSVKMILWDNEINLVGVQKEG